MNRHKKQCTKFLYLVLIVISLFPQSSPAQEKENKIKLVGYTEAYYTFDLDQPENRQRPAFIYNHKRHNEFNINLAYLGFNYKDSRVKSNFVLMAGNYAQYNLSSEPGILQHIMEATAAIKISDTKNLWLEAGIFPSHIGFESAVGIDCQTLTRSILAENSPYYESGIKINYSNNEKNQWSILLLNGWQKIARNQNDELPSLGLQYQRKLNQYWNFNYSNFLGYMNKNQASSFRQFHNLYAQRKGKGNWDYTLGFDLGLQNKQAWYSAVGIARLALSEKNYCVLRAEYYHDPQLIITTTPGREAFSVAGFSAGYDLMPLPNAALRFEAKQYLAKNRTFLNVDGKVNVCFTMSLSVKLE
jgi:hypothetical protein